ncbi:MAG: hypothetical protein QM602_02740 [Microbacterium sp.]
MTTHTPRIEPDPGDPGDGKPGDRKPRRKRSLGRTIGIAAFGIVAGATAIALVLAGILTWTV